MSAPTPDPVDDPSGYQRHLLGLLGGDDPAAVQSGTPGAWRALVAEAGDLVGRRPEPAEWSVLECLGHAVDAELVSATRYRWILAHDEPPLIGYDQDLWVDRLHGRNDDPEELLELLETLRRANLGLWQRTGPEERARVGIHAERGPESLDLVYRLIAGHDRFHLDQARRALEAVRRG
ncbi:MAG TPA: DinB family protein [Actinomycetota bacterium]|nr:DinB family protein [Actinomycetota bacterium]